MSAESLQQLQQLAVRGPWTIRPSMPGAGNYWHVEGPSQLRVAVCVDEATAAFIATACNQLRERDDGRC